MKNFTFSLFIFCLFISLLDSCSKRKAVPQFTSLKVYKEFDKSRTFDTTSNEKAPFYYRPVRIDLYYPSTEGPVNKPLTYGDLLDMYEQRMNYNNPVDSCKIMSMNLAKSFAEYLHIDSAQKILSAKTGIYLDLRLPEERHPLIIYAAGMNGSSWENEILFDSLARAGFVVAAISSVGLYPGYMSSPADLDEQVQDILYAKKFISTQPFIDTSKIGLLSWSMGGSAITKAAMLSNNIRCLLSFDGTEIHYYGTDTSWDLEFDEIIKIPPFNPELISAPYLYLSSEHPKERDSIYVFPNFISSKEKYYFQFNGGTHEDFSSIIAACKMAEPRIGNVDSSRHETVCKLAVTFFNQYLKGNGESISASFSKLIADKPKAYTTHYPVK
jgi:hypothetical protein